MTLMEVRHPRLARLEELWRRHRMGTPLPLASALAPDRLDDLADLTVILIHCDDGSGGLEIARSSLAVDALYGVRLAGKSARRLGSLKGDAEQEALTAIETARPLLVEEEMMFEKRRLRVARLYLPLANDDGSADGVLCGVVAVA